VLRKACVFRRLRQLLLLEMRLLVLETWHLAAECLPLRGMRGKVTMLTMLRIRVGIIVKEG